jgi:hypothetical protein
MVIQKTIDKLRERPHHERRRVAALAALSVIGVLFLLWSVTFFAGISRQTGGSKTPPADQTASLDYVRGSN